MKHFNREYFTNEWESESTRAHRTKKDGIEMWLNKPNVSVVYACLGVCVCVCICMSLSARESNEIDSDAAEDEHHHRWR